MPMQINLKDFLDYASHKNPGAVARAVMATAKKRIGRGLRGLGDTAPYDTLLSQLQDPNLYSLSVAPTAQTGFLANGQTSPVGGNPIVVNSSGVPVSSSGTWTDIFNNLTAAVPNLLTAYTANKQLSACAQTNQARLSQGLPAIDCSAFAPTAQVGLTSSTTSLLFVLGGGALLLLALSGRRKKA